MKLLTGICLQKINNAPLAIRILLLVVLLLIIIMVQFWLWDKLQQGKNSLDKRIKIVSRELPLLQTNLEQTQQKLQQHKKLAVAISSRKSRAKNQLMSPPDMTAALADLLQERNDLVLLSVQNLPVKTVTKSDSKLILFESGVVIKFCGGYFATLRYLQDLDALIWHFFWDSLTYQVTKYPVAEVTLQLHTISKQKGWIHV